MTQLFDTPSKKVFMGAGDRLWRRKSIWVSLSVLKESGRYRLVESPSNEEIAAADIAYLGGRTYEVSDDEAAQLRAAGYAAGVSSTVTPGGYGWGAYGEGAYGDGDPSSTPTAARPYGAGPYGSGPYE